MIVAAFLVGLLALFLCCFVPLGFLVTSIVLLSVQVRNGRRLRTYSVWAIVLSALGLPLDLLGLVGSLASAETAGAFVLFGGALLLGAGSLVLAVFVWRRGTRLMAAAAPAPPDETEERLPGGFG